MKSKATQIKSSNLNGATVTEMSEIPERVSGKIYCWLCIQQLVGHGMVNFLEWQALHCWTMLCQGWFSWYYPLSIKHLSTFQHPLWPESRNKCSCNANSWRPATPIRLKGSVLMLALQQSQAQNLHSDLFQSVCSNKASNAAPHSRRW